MMNEPTEPKQKPAFKRRKVLKAVKNWLYITTLAFAVIAGVDAALRWDPVVQPGR